ncbi:hypothetical protein PRIPAC_79109 [Pristionchus pacificus]|uniref:Nuclear receptor n=1 Tax=Pristionchus pacificus TaxID=54126 RepID=A0A2A6CLH7_PRIPA|nr:hypothetical protein PRIPAC_79109 [Pristionchus pacificus]|eukprot:PDM78938.1 nuclear receptor [Pristionchus pacificus]
MEGWPMNIYRELYSVHIDTLYPMFCAFGVECFTFFTNVFSSLLQLRLDEQITIFKHFMPKLSMFECYHRSRLIWKEHGRYTMISMVTCFDSELGIDGDTGRFENSSFLSSSASSYAADHNAILQPLFNRIELMEEELHALIALLLCEIDVPLSDEAHQYLDDYRAEALEDLQTYYREELGMEDYSRRLGNLMTLSHTVQECKSRFLVFFRFAATIFDIHMEHKEGIVNGLTIVAFPLQILAWIIFADRSNLISPHATEPTIDGSPILLSIFVHVLYYVRVIIRGERQYKTHFFLDEVIVAVAIWVTFIAKLFGYFPEFCIFISQPVGLYIKNRTEKTEDDAVYVIDDKKNVRFKKWFMNIVVVFAFPTQLVFYTSMLISSYGVLVVLTIVGLIVSITAHFLYFHNVIWKGQQQYKAHFFYFENDNAESTKRAEINFYNMPREFTAFPVVAKTMMS